MVVAEVMVNTLHEIGFTIGYVIVAALGAYSAYHAKKAKESSDQINDAVNHRHDKAGPHAPKLYDAVIGLHERANTIDDKADELLEWKRGYAGGRLDTGDKVKDFVESVDELKEQVTDLCERCPCSDLHGQKQTGS